MISEKKEAASMTPAANPNAKSRTPRFGLLVNKIGSAPTAVIKPAASKVLLKPTLQMKHEGKKRFETGSAEYQILLDWIKAGAAEDSNEAPHLESISVSPGVAMLTAPGNSLALKVTATFSDGEQLDVTRWAVYETSNLIAEVTAAGVLEFAQTGETTVFARYLSGRASMRAGMIHPRKGYRWSGPAPANTIDKHVFSKLKQFKENPAASCDDATFMRRACLDITGTLPDPREAKAFVDERDPGKRARLIERLLASPEYAEFWALKWADLLRVEEKTLDAKGVEIFHNWIREGLATGKPLDVFAHEVLSATGSTYGNPPANFYRALRFPVDRAEAAAQVFLGSRLKCARCHDHPFEDVRQDDYYRFAALFDGIDYEIVENKRKDKFDKHQFRGEQKVKLVALDKLDPKIVLKHPRTRKPPEPGLLERGAPPLASMNRRLEEMAQWVISHPNFARVQANRIWFHMTGRPLIEPLQRGGEVQRWIDVSGQLQCRGFQVDVVLPHQQLCELLVPGETHLGVKRRHSALPRKQAVNLATATGMSRVVPAKFYPGGTVGTIGVVKGIPKSRDFSGVRWRGWR